MRFYGPLPLKVSGYPSPTAPQRSLHWYPTTGDRFTRGHYSMAQSSQSLPKMHAAFDLQNIIERIKGVLTFSRTTITSIAADRGATLEAALVVVAIGLATAIGYRDDVVTTITATLIGWAGFTGAVWFIADRFLGTPTSRGSFVPLLRTVGYAQAPAALALVHFIWGLGPMIGVVGWVWSFAATVFALHHTTQFGYPRSVALTLVGGLAVAIFGFIFSVFTSINPQIW